MANEPLSEHPATLHELREEESIPAAAVEAPLQAEGAEPVVEKAESSQDESPAPEEGGKEE